MIALLQAFQIHCTLRNFRHLSRFHGPAKVTGRFEPVDIEASSAASISKARSNAQ